MRNYAVWLIGILILIGVNVSIWHKEQLIAHGTTVFLPLAPVDPRSLMQGDYMRLRFALEQDIVRQLPHDKTKNADGYVLVQLNEQAIAEFVKVESQLPPSMAAQQLAMRYRVREGQVKFATDAFFFEEGKADVYAQARYGEFRVADDGELLLHDLRGQDLRILPK